MQFSLFFFTEFAFIFPVHHVIKEAAAEPDTELVLKSVEWISLDKVIRGLISF